MGCSQMRLGRSDSWLRTRHCSEVSRLTTYSNTRSPKLVGRGLWSGRHRGCGRALRISTTNTRTQPRIWRPSGGGTKGPGRARGRLAGQGLRGPCLRLPPPGAKGIALPHWRRRRQHPRESLVSAALSGPRPALAGPLQRASRPGLPRPQSFTAAWRRPAQGNHWRSEQVPENERPP